MTKDLGSSLRDTHRAPDGWVLVPIEPTDEMLRVSLATDLPATYREYLRHPMNGEKTARDVERAIEKERKRWGAMIEAAARSASQVGMEPSPSTAE